MRLLNANTKTLTIFHEDCLPEYAILSHTWGEDEVVFQDLQTPSFSQKPSWRKIEGCCETALKHNLEWIWVDTCCIDKSNSTELTEAINSMFRWYQNSTCCYVYLSDVLSEPLHKTLWLKELAESRWFTRGWTLQELLAPSDLHFFDVHWLSLGPRSHLSRTIEAVTGIPGEYLLGHNIGYASIAQRMSWAAGRQTTKREDMAYCLLGIFGVNMNMLYGEGDRAFLRLQEEIIKQSNDQSLLAWQRLVPLDRNLPGHEEAADLAGPLALSPADFKTARHLVATNAWASHGFEMTKRGLLIELPLVTFDGGLLATGCHYPGKQIYGILNCCSTGLFGKLIGIPLDLITPLDRTKAAAADSETPSYARRRHANGALIFCDDADFKRARMTKIYIGKEVSAAEIQQDIYFTIRFGQDVPKSLVQIRPLQRDSSYRYSRAGDELTIKLRSKMLPEAEDIEEWQRTFLCFGGKQPPLHRRGSEASYSVVIFCSRRGRDLQTVRGGHLRPTLGSPRRQNPSELAWCRLTDVDFSTDLRQHNDLKARNDHQLRHGEKELVLEMRREDSLGQWRYLITLNYRSGQEARPTYIQVNPVPCERVGRVMAVVVLFLGLVITWTLAHSQGRHPTHDRP